jgi:hypothetical protein
LENFGNRGECLLRQGDLEQIELNDTEQHQETFGGARNQFLLAEKSRFVTAGQGK